MSLVELELGDGVATVALAVPERRNALSRELLVELRRALDEAERLGAAAIVLTGRGPVFSAGADLGELTGTVDDVAVDDAVQGACRALGECPLPVLAAIEGGCVGAAVDLALACDVRIVARDAFFAVPAVALGILYSPEALARMAGRAGHQTLVRLLLLGERIAGEQAVVTGLAARVAPSGGALEAALDAARGAAA
ncbi:MAG: enoyl-CoA hydratase/isomerase family protein, partial [Solirubrobacteraceae bacterium]|nr:enoyl-CoA hydratase/isomerase family protein [Solirubrobacteraceae bacterium]